MGTDQFMVEGIAVSTANHSQASHSVCSAVTAGRSLTVFTINLDHVTKLRRDSRFRAAYQRAGIILADGFPIVFSGRIQGRRLSRTTGADLIEPLCAEAASRGISVAFYGSTFKSLSGAAKYLKARYPTLEIAGVYAPEHDLDVLSPAAAEGRRYIRETNAGICFVALGAPKQEVFADACGQTDDGIAYVCIGAGLDFLAGQQRRAPRLFQKTGLEWFWRLVHSPRRLGRRYFDCLIVLPSILWSALKAR